MKSKSGLNEKGKWKHNHHIKKNSTEMSRIWQDGFSCIKPMKAET